MKEILEDCPNCGMRLFFGAFFEALASIEKAGFDYDDVLGLGFRGKIDDCRAAYLGCVIDGKNCCPRCHTLVVKEDCRLPD